MAADSNATSGIIGRDATTAISGIIDTLATIPGAITARGFPLATCRLQEHVAFGFPTGRRVISLLQARVGN